MKIRRSILWLSVIVVVFVALLFWLARKPAETPLITETESNVVPTSVVNPTPLVKTNAPITAAAQQAAFKSEWAGKVEIFSSYNNVPIDFYGKLEDQFGSPVAGAEIKAGAIISGDEKRNGTDHFTTTSDANGLFEFHGKGESIGMMPRKEGYALASTETLFKYSHLEEHPFTSDAYNPTVIKMWKLQGAEPLLKINQTYKLSYTSAPINFDLLAGEVVPNRGDMRITVNRAPGIAQGRSRPDWSLTIEAVDGGLIETSMAESRVTYIAPDSGYQPGTNFIFSTNAPYKWTAGFDQVFFVQSRNGQMYSKVGLSFGINSKNNEPMYVTFRGVANTNGSRNWEGDPNTMQAAGQ